MGRKTDPKITPIRPNVRPDKARSSVGRGITGTTPSGMAEPPECLGEAAAAIWRDTVRSAPDGLLQMADVPLLTAYCNCAAIAKEAAAILHREGLIATGRSDAEVRHPATTVLSTATAGMLAAARELGLTPRSRARLGVAVNPATPDDGYSF